MHYKYRLIRRYAYENKNKKNNDSCVDYIFGNFINNYSKCREYGAVFKFNGVKDVENKLKQAEK